MYNIILVSSSNLERKIEKKNIFCSMSKMTFLETTKTN